MKNAMRLTGRGLALVSARGGLTLPGGSAFAEATEELPATPVVQSIQGAAELKVTQGKKSRQVKEGAPLLTGDKLQTEDDVSATVLYPDGSKVEISPKTTYQIEQKIDGTQWNRLGAGQVRGIINKIKEMEKNPAAKPHFLIRTRTATMGVRGTDFVMSINSKGVTQVHTIEGTVEVARDPLSLMSGRGAAVAEGHSIQATNSGLGGVESYDKDAFLKELGASASSGPAVSGGAGAATGAIGSATVSGGSPPIPAPAPLPRLPSLGSNMGEGSGLSGPTKPGESKPNGGTPAEKIVEQRIKEEEESKIRLIDFQIGMLYARTPNDVYRMMSVNWTPQIPLPVLRFIQIRGNFGAAFQFSSVQTQDVVKPDIGKLNGFLIHEYQIYVSMKLLKPLYFEVGGGEQIWRRFGFDTGVLSANVGFITGESKWLSHLYLGVTSPRTSKAFTEFRAGAQFNLW